MARTVTADIRLGTFVDRFEREGWAQQGPAWLRQARVQAMQRFSELGLPDRRTPSWEHTDTSALRHAYAAPDGSGKLDPAVLERAAFSDEAARLVLVDGAFRPDLSRLGDLPEGVQAVDLTTVWDSPAFRDPQLARLEHADAGACLGLAFLQGGVFLHVPAGTKVEHPIHVVHVHTRPGTATATKHVVLAGAGAEATVVESWVGSAPGTLTLHTTELVLPERARVQHVKQQLEHAAAVHKGRVEADVGRDSHVGAFLWSEGAAWSRSGTRVRLVAPGATCSVDGLWLGRGKQEHDCPTLIEHNAPHTTSRELYKGVLEGEAHGIFLGNVIVHQGAQGTDSHQTNRNLLLSTKSRIDTTPQLEIHADDVQCAHGSTIGRLDQDALFFLRARGIGRERAELILTKAFAGEVLAQVPSWGIRTRLERRVEEWFPGGAA